MRHDREIVERSLAGLDLFSRLTGRIGRRVWIGIDLALPTS